MSNVYAHALVCWGGDVWPTLLSTVDMPCHYALRHMLTLEHTHTHTHTHMQTSSVVICQCFNWLPCKHNGPSPPTLLAAVVLTLQLSLLVNWALRRAGKGAGLRGTHFFAHCRQCYRTHITPLLVYIRYPIL